MTEQTSASGVTESNVGPGVNQTPDTSDDAVAGAQTPITQILLPPTVIMATNTVGAAGSDSNLQETLSSYECTPTITPNSNLDLEQSSLVRWCCVTSVQLKSLPHLVDACRGPWHIFTFSCPSFQTIKKAMDGDKNRVHILHVSLSFSLTREETARY